MNETADDSRRGTIHYRRPRRRHGDGAPILFVHGLLVDGRLWDGVAERLSGSHRCLVADWPMGSHRTADEPRRRPLPAGDRRAGRRASSTRSGSTARPWSATTRGGAVSQMLTAAHPDRVERLMLTNCDLFENFPPFPFNLMPPLARLPGGMTVLAAPFRIGAVRRATYAHARQAPDPAASWSTTGSRRRADPAIQPRRAQADRRREQAADARRGRGPARLRATDPVRLGARGPVLRHRARPAARRERPGRPDRDGSPTRGRSSRSTSRSGSPS